MKDMLKNGTVVLDVDQPIWDKVFTVAPLVVIGTKENNTYDLAPKHMASPIGFNNYFGFICTPKHATYRNIMDWGEFTVSFPKPDQVIISALTASPRCDDISKSDQIIKALPTEKAPNIDALILSDSYLYFECERYKIIDGFDDNSIITGRIKSAYVDQDYLRSSERSDQDQIYKHSLLAYIATGRYAEIKETFEFPFPKDFKR
ncbi:MAG: flavin reductase [Flavobacteriaceae bacterium]|nr:flavin reductase [Flavobacteriaceae bacterium]